MALFLNNGGGAWDNAKNILNRELAEEKEVKLTKRLSLEILLEIHAKM